jgi:hypothetical protein
MAARRLTTLMLGTGLALLMAGGTVKAGTFPVFTNSFDTVVGISFSIGGGPDLTGYYVDDPDPRVGSVNAQALLRQVKIYGFKLPVLDAPTIASAELILSSATLNNPNNAFNLDLYGLNTSNPDVTGTTLFFQGDDDFSQQKLADPYVMGSGFGPTAGPHIAGATAFIQGLYSGTTPTQSEAFFRLNPDTAFFVSPPNVNEFISADFLVNGFLLITTIPEPASVLLLLPAVLIAPLVGRRRSMATILPDSILCPVRC